MNTVRSRLFRSRLALKSYLESQAKSNAGLRTSAWQPHPRRRGMQWAEPTSDQQELMLISTANCPPTRPPRPCRTWNSAPSARPSLRILEMFPRIIGLGSRVTRSGISPELNAALGERLQRRPAAKITSSRSENRVRTNRWVWAGALAIVCLVVGLKLILTSRNRNEDRSTAYPSMASIEKYLMPDRNAEIALARSAAPEAISSDARILVLGWRGYETADEGKNGFVCMVERSWMSPFNSAEFWNPRIRVRCA